MRELLQGIHDWMEEQEESFISDIRRLVEIPSVSVAGDEADPYGKECSRVLEVMRQLAWDNGFSGEILENRCLEICWGEGKKELGIWGHLDVVPEGKGWVYPPYACTFKDGFLIGRGVQDNKGPVVAVLYALKYLKEKGFMPGIRIRQILGCQEEAGMTDVDYYLSVRPAPDYSFVSDCSFPVCYGEKGIFTATLLTPSLSRRLSEFSGGMVRNAVPAKARARMDGIWYDGDGIAGHAAFPEGTKNALAVLCGVLLTVAPDREDAQVLKALLELCGDGYGRALGLPEGSTCNVGCARMQGQQLRLELDIRYPVDEKGERMLEKLRAFVGEKGFQILRYEDSKPNLFPPESGFVQTLMKAYRQITMDGRGAYIMGGGTYARKIPHAVGFGPGMEADMRILGLPEGHGGCHSADEAQSLKNLKRAVEIYAAAIIEVSRWLCEEM
ncbi:MAG TPA: M20/M25/M40 family metallo-hydrolase [Candidatus Pullilachnospira intestinigallinarum]|nr:M20/M25/M40 family metallo-hydrolase [Candidatus Pullilachnospira intestinigallinarum]